MREMLVAIISLPNTAHILRRLRRLLLEIQGGVVCVEVGGLKSETPRLDAKYPKWRGTVKTRSFRRWLAKQPQRVKSLVESTREKDAITVLDLYTQRRK